MKVLFRVLFLTIFLLLGQSAQAVLEIEITQGVEGALPIAVAVFAGDTYTAPEAVENIVRNDLASSGFFDVLEKQRFPNAVVNPSQLDFNAWRNAGVESLLLGKITQAGEQYRIEFQLIDLIRKKRLLGNVIPAGTKDVRKVAHKISDLVFEALTGIRGAFSTRVAYVSTVNKGTADQKYVLQVADADGHNARTIFSSKKQILSPAWSPDGSRLAYVSFESGNSAIYVQDIIQGTRAKVSAKSGIVWLLRYLQAGAQISIFWILQPRTYNVSPVSHRLIPSRVGCRTEKLYYSLLIEVAVHRSTMYQ